MCTVLLPPGVNQTAVTNISVIHIITYFPYSMAIISSAYGVKLDSRMLDKILYVVGKSDLPL